MNQIPSQGNQFIEGNENYTAQGYESQIVQGNNNHVTYGNLTVNNYNNTTDPQIKIKHSSYIINEFYNEIKPEDIEIWKCVYFCTYEGAGAEFRHFVVYDKNRKARQIPLSQLFRSEGKGLVLPQAQFNRSDEVENLDLSSIRRIAEELDRMSYNILYVYDKNIEISLIYHKTGQIMNSIYRWINEIEDDNLKKDIKSGFSYFIEMYSQYKNKFETLPIKRYVNFC